MNLVPPSDARSSVARVRGLYLRALGFIFVLAFASLVPQLSALLGPGGLSPAAELLEYARQVLPASGRFLRLPTLLEWFGAGEGVLRGVCFAGLGCGLLLVANVAPRWSLIGAWAYYLSLTTVGGVFLSYFALHGAVVVAAILVVWGLGRSPRSGAVWRALLITNAYAALVGVVNLVFGTNFLFLCAKPEGRTLLDWFGPWPVYILVAEFVALGLFTLLALPFRRGSPHT